jgi:hypothetical protein
MNLTGKVMAVAAAMEKQNGNSGRGGRYIGLRR